jgi:hypothetical protein
MTAITAQPELELLLACGRLELETARAQRVRELLNRDLDWDRVLSLAHQHGLVPLLHFHINALDPAALRNPGLEELGAFSFAITSRNLHLTAELLELLDAFEADGIPAIPFKGPALTVQLYGNLALRRFSDLDIAVLQTDVPKVFDLLTSRGYDTSFRLTGAQGKAHRKFQYACNFLSQDGEVTIDLHWGFAKKYFVVGLHPESSWDHTQDVTVQGTRITTFAPEMLLLILCLHGAKHGPVPWPRLNWIADIAELVRRRPALDWRRVQERARSLGSQRTLYLGLALASELLEAPLPDDIRQQVRADRVAQRLATTIRDRILTASDDSFSPIARFWFDFKLRERLRDKLQYSLRRLTLPGPRDWQIIELPTSLALLYLPLRIARLLAKYLFSPWKLRGLWSRSNGS